MLCLLLPLRHPPLQKTSASSFLTWMPMTVLILEVHLLEVEVQRHRHPHLPRWSWRRPRWLRVTHQRRLESLARPRSPTMESPTRSRSPFSRSLSISNSSCVPGSLHTPSWRSMAPTTLPILSSLELPTSSLTTASFAPPSFPFVHCLSYSFLFLPSSLTIKIIHLIASFFSLIRSVTHSFNRSGGYKSADQVQVVCRSR